MREFRPYGSVRGALSNGRPYRDQGNVEACAAAGIAPVIAMGREVHHPSLNERFAEPPPPPENSTPLEAMAHRLQTPQGKKRYVLRKQIPEPVFGIVKSVLGFRQFLLRGLDKVRGEWSLVTMAWNVKRIFVLVGANGEKLPVFRHLVAAARPLGAGSRSKLLDPAPIASA